MGVSLHGREQPHAAADHGSLVHIEYTLLFDPQQVLRYWLRKDCGQSLDLNSASANELRTLPGLRGVDVSRIIAGRPYQSRDELLTREIVPQPGR